MEINIINLWTELDMLSIGITYDNRYIIFNGNYNKRLVFDLLIWSIDFEW